MISKGIEFFQIKKKIIIFVIKFFFDPNQPLKIYYYFPDGEQLDTDIKYFYPDGMVLYPKKLPEFD